MTMIELYEKAIAQGEISDDPQQRPILPYLQAIIDGLAPSKYAWLLFGRKKKINGLYLYGPVGVGKTYLVDLFYDHVTEKKSRFHFHHFMQQIDAQLRRLQGKKDPLRHIATNIAKSTRLLCLDEFLVYDVADAMILAELLQVLFKYQVVLVATANTCPDDLYLDGVHRERFLPAIDLIKQHCNVLQLTEEHDYRLGREPLLHAYISPLNAAAETSLTKQFNDIATNTVEKAELSVQNRQISTIKLGVREVWFKFDVICNLPRCQLDYLEIADRFDTIFVSDIPVLSADDTVRVLLLILFIDVMYDRGIRLVISAAVSAANLYTAGPMLKTFRRTLSRLEEMQSADYLRRHAHRQIQSL
jgi:cell division protein ZapE